MPLGPVSDNSRYDCSPPTLFDALTVRRRRLVLQYLAEAESPVLEDEQVADLASHADDHVERTSVAITLIHQHLPKLADAGMVRFDREMHTVEEGPAASYAAHHLAFVDDREAT